MCSIPSSNACTDVIERLDRQSTGIGFGLEHQRRNRTDQYDLGDMLSTMAPDVAGNLGAAGGEANEEGPLQIELLDELGEVVGIRVHVVPFQSWLERP